jgi:hypothetical protein
MPGAGHKPPYLPGREHEKEKEFAKLLDQDTILKNLILTGLRGLGKMVLVRKHVRLGTIPSVRIGRRVLVPMQGINDLTMKGV